jgi:hypothetical protein
MYKHTQPNAAAARGALYSQDLLAGVYMHNPLIYNRRKALFIGALGEFIGRIAAMSELNWIQIRTTLD